MPTKSIDKQWVDVLADVPIFQGLSRRHLSRIAGMATLQEVAPHTQIVRAGEPGDAFYVIIDGHAEARQPGHKGVEMGSGDFFGEMALLDGGPRSAIVEAKTQLLALRIGRAPFQTMLEKEGSVAAQMLRTMAERLRSANARVSD
jgi:CRP-like cAMP-binding protein